MLNRIIYLMILNIFVFFSILEGGTLILLMGSPGAGKGTFSNFLKKNGHFIHLCFGDILREEINANTEQGNIFKSYVTNGALIPSNLSFPFFESHFVQNLSQNENIIIDGIVQSDENVKFFDFLINKYHLDNDIYYVYINVDYNTALERLFTRMICRACNQVFSSYDHTHFCPICHNILEKRIDDNDKTILNRLDRFWNSTIFLIDHYRKNPNFYEFDGTKDIKFLENEYRSIFLIRK